jgi:predicted nucleic acid-binding protein
MIVVDASVAVKWVTGEPDREAANELLASNEAIFGPFLLRTEVASAVARKARFGEISRDDGFAALALWASIIRGNVAAFSEDPDLPRALQLALELEHPLQDCVYLALAERLEATLVTADEKFVAKARRRHPRIRALASFRPK